MASWLLSGSSAGYYLKPQEKGSGWRTAVIVSTECKNEEKSTKPNPASSKIESQFNGGFQIARLSAVKLSSEESVPVVWEREKTDTSLE